MKKIYPFKIHMGVLLIVILSLSSIALTFFTYRANVDLVEKKTNKVLRSIVKEVKYEIERNFSIPESVTRIISKQAIDNSLGQSTTFKQRMQTIPFLSELLSNLDQVLSIYAAYENGEFFQLKKVVEKHVLPDINQEIKWIVRSIAKNESGEKVLTRVFLDKSLKTLHIEKLPSNYDPHKREWYQQALLTSETLRSDPLLFSSDHKLGFIFSQRVIKTNENLSNKNVIGTSVYLKNLSEALGKQKISNDSEIILFDHLGQLVAYKDSEYLLIKNSDSDDLRRGTIEDIKNPALNTISLRWKKELETGKKYFDSSISGEPWRHKIIQLKMRIGNPLYLSISIPHREIFQNVRTIRDQTLLITFLFLIILYPTSFLIASRISRPIRELSAEANAVQRFDFSEHPAVLSSISEIQDLSQSMTEMKSTIRRFQEVNMMIASEDDFTQLLPILLQEVLSAANADSGALYLVDAEGRLNLNALNIKKVNIDVADEALEKPIVIAKSSNLLQKAIAEKQSLTGFVSLQEFAQCHLEQLIQAQNGQKSHSIALPLFNRKSELVGAMLLFTREITAEALLKFISALSASLAITLENKELIQAQKELFEAFIKLIAGAIDSKSPYTGGHCARVPELTKLLAEAAHQSKQDSFAEFSITADEWESIHVASWLHDCGKVTTPEYVVDKATKLETIYDRIHEVRMRFEVLRRDAEIRYWQGLANQGDKTQLQAQLKRENQQLDDDYLFIAQCNEGGEFMTEEQIDRLQLIAQKTWLRTFNDRIGISQEEKIRKQRNPEALLPVEENLLSDKTEHEFKRRDSEIMPLDNPWHFKMDEPELLYNKGEIYNLSVARGTLSAEERFKINEHIVQTIIMLSQLPFPKHLQKVTEIAGGHHEKMDGSGYPRQLKREDMSVVARIMAIADIFEALTAVDRPYKKGKTLSEAIRIMDYMVQDKHIDPALFKLFLSSGVYLEYAKKHLKAEQIDSVDVTQYLE